MAGVLAATRGCTEEKGKRSMSAIRHEVRQELNMVQRRRGSESERVRWSRLALLVLLIVELLNSAIENTVDRIGDEMHELAGRAKDMGSAAVMLSLLLVAICWGAIIWTRVHA